MDNCKKCGGNKIMCVCSEGVKCTRCDIIDKMNVVIDEIGKIIYC